MDIVLKSTTSSWTFLEELINEKDNDDLAQFEQGTRLDTAGQDYLETQLVEKLSLDQDAVAYILRLVQIPVDQPSLIRLADAAIRVATSGPENKKRGPRVKKCAASAIIAQNKPEAGSSGLKGKKILIDSADHGVKKLHIHDLFLVQKNVYACRHKGMNNEIGLIS